jgi:hypothetical protein
MNRYYLIILLLLCGCATLKKENMAVNGSANDAINNAIFDFIHTEKRLLKDDNTFLVSADTVERNIAAITIIGNPNKITLIADFADSIKKNTVARFDEYKNVSVIDTINNDTIFRITGDNDHPSLWINKDKVSYNYRAFPTMLIETDGKLFFWYDKTKNVTDTIINTLYRYNFVDTMIVNAYIPEHSINDAQKGIVYYFCENNLRNYKKTGSNTLTKHYKPPKLKCE